MLVGAALLLARAALAQPQRPGQPAPLPPLPLTQLDERAASADLDGRTFTQTFAQPTPVNDVLLLLVRGTGLSIVPDPGVRGTFVGELKRVSIRQALELILEPLGLGYSVDGSLVRVFRREPATRLFDVNYLAAERVGASRIGTVDAQSGDSVVSVTSTTKGDVFADLSSGVKTLLSPDGSYNLDRKAGVLRVTDLPDRLDRVSAYLDAVRDRVHRQAQIDARVLEVELNDEKAAGIDWAAAMGSAQTQARALVSMRAADVAKLLAALEAQGKVTTVATPRLLTLNNEPAIIRTEALSLSVTAQIANDTSPASMTLSLTPAVRKPALAESDMVARVAEGETLVVSGFTRDRESRERRSAGVTGGGWFGRSTVVTRRRVELVILLTPRIVTDVTTP